MTVTPESIADWARRMACRRAAERCLRHGRGATEADCDALAAHLLVAAEAWMRERFITEETDPC